MSSMRITGIAVALIVLVAQSAAGEFIPLDLATAGDGNITRDTVGGLDWLDVDVVSPVLSYSQIVGGADGWYADGWRFATRGELDSLAGQMDTSAHAEALVRLLGTNFACNSNPGYFNCNAAGSFDDGEASSISVMNISFRSGNVPDEWGLVVIQDDRSPSSPLARTFLVRPVPEPGSSAMLLIGLGLLSARRSRQARHSN